MDDVCTCGESLKGIDPSRHFDVSGMCVHDNHTQCRDVMEGSLLSATGFHWVCACLCHLEPKMPDDADGARALQTWRTARARLVQGAIT